MIWVVYSRLNAKGQLTAAKWEPFLTSNLWTTYVLPGMQGTLTAAAVSIVLALALGFVLGVGRLSTHNAIRWVCSVVVEFFRAVPVLIMMIFAYFLYAQYDVFPSKHLALAGVITGLTLYNGAVIAEIVRAGVNALPRGQSEAASALGHALGPDDAVDPAAAGDHVDVAGADIAAGGRPQGLRDRLHDHVPRDGAAGRPVGRGVRQLLPALIVIAILMISVNFALVVVRCVVGRPAASVASGPDAVGSRDHRAGGGAGRSRRARGSEQPALDPPPFPLACQLGA